MKVRPVAVGLATAVLGGSLFLVYARRLEIQTSGGQRVEVLVATAKIDRGTPLKDSLLSTRSIPQAYVDERMVRASDREQIMGLKAAEVVGVNQTVFWSDVVTTREDTRDLSGLVQPGYRAVTAPFAAHPTFSLIRPGDFVDVLSIVPHDQSGSKDAIVLLQRVLVLAIGNDLTGSGKTKTGPGGAPPSLTLSLTLPEAQLLSLAAQGGQLTVALRNPNDQRVADQPESLDSEDVYDPDAREAVVAVRKHESPAPPAAPKKL